MAIPSRAVLQRILKEKEQAIWEARQLADNGYNVIFLHNNNKNPLIRRKYLDVNHTILNPMWASNDPEKIEWLADKFYPCNIGIYTPGTDLVVIDADNKKLVIDGKPLFDGLTGVELYYRLAYFCPEILDTVKVKTPSGGMHYYFRAPRGWTIRGFNGNQLLAKSEGRIPFLPAWYGMDVRARESYGIIVCPFSKKNGIKYEYVGDRTLLNTPLDNLPILPDVFLSIFKRFGYARRMSL